MVLELISRVAANRLNYNYIPLVIGLTTLLGIRSYSKGYVCNEQRNIRGSTWILVGGLTGAGLVLLRQLALLGAQIIALHPNPSDPSIHQLIVLLRESTSNERIYADECDMRDVGSIRRFVKRWEKDGRMGMVGDLEARVEGVVFCSSSSSDGVDPHWEYLTSRHAFVQLFLPTLLKSSLPSPVRLIFQLSPFYSASPPLHPPFPPFPSLSHKRTWVKQGTASLLSIALFREFQDRTDTSSAALKSKSQGIITTFVSPGLPRSYLFSALPLLLYILLYPLIWTFAKSGEEGAQGPLMAVLGAVERIDVPDVDVPEKEEKKEGKRKEEKVRVRLRGGAVYAEGKPIRIPRLEVAGPTLGPTLWELESKKVERLVEEAIREEKEAEAKKEMETGREGLEERTAKGKGKKDL